MVADEDDDRAVPAGGVLERISPAVRRRKPEIGRSCAKRHFHLTERHRRASFVDKQHITPSVLPSPVGRRVGDEGGGESSRLRGRGSAASSYRLAQDPHPALRATFSRTGEGSEWSCRKSESVVA